MDKSDEELAPDARERAAEALARARALRDEAAAVQAQARQQHRHRQVRAIVRESNRIAAELRRLDREIEVWDGVHRPVQHLTERQETVEAALSRVEAMLRALRPRLSDEPAHWARGGGRRGRPAQREERGRASRWPRVESNHRTQLRRLPLCPLSYGASATTGYRRRYAATAAPNFRFRYARYGLASMPDPTAF
jgi:hypothetical protein